MAGFRQLFEEQPHLQAVGRGAKIHIDHDPTPVLFRQGQARRRLDQSLSQFVEF
jgi:hypothetical protein